MHHHYYSGGTNYKWKRKSRSQDIADALGLSRNTVSKALNNTGVLAEETRQKILEKAAEMGYRRFIYLAQPSAAENTEVKELALFTQNMPYGSHFGTYALNTFQEKISRNNYRLSMFPVREAEISSLQLPMGFNKEKTEGIICMEMFDPDYIEMLSSLDIPLLLIDTAADTDITQVKADILLMENHMSIYNLTDTLIQNGYRNLAFAAIQNTAVLLPNGIRDSSMPSARIISPHLRHSLPEGLFSTLPTPLRKPSDGRFSFLTLLYAPTICCHRSDPHAQETGIQSP